VELKLSLSIRLGGSGVRASEEERSRKKLDGREGRAGEGVPA
jgi:hypothetical protein